MNNDSHDDVANGDGGENPGAAIRHFAEPDGTSWEVKWHAPVPKTTYAKKGIYVFRELGTGASFRIAAGSSGGDRLQKMPLADLRQLLTLARSGLVDE